MLRNIALVIAFTLFAITAFSQDATKTDLKKHSIRVGWDFNNHQFGLDQTGYDDFSEYTRGIEVAYIRNFTKIFNLAFPVTGGTNRYLNENDELGDSEAYIGLDVLGQALIASRKYIFSPYIFAGIGGEWQFFNENEITGTIPFGVGLDWNVRKDWYVGIRGGYRLGLNDGDYLQLNLGLTAPLGKTGSNEIPAVISDLDGDGINDNEDECPNVAGIYAFNGCPDSDGDGVQDSKDECPDVAGLIELNGCLPTDTDGDGVPDSEDKCPSTEGSAEMDGCPDSDGDGVSDADDQCPDEQGTLLSGGCPDSDGDGVRDIDDKCPNEPGVASNNGCPEKTDSDGDGFSDDIDKCPEVPGALNGCPDSDLDGVADPDDKCPKIAGSISYNGCPELQADEKAILERAKEAIEFETASARIRSSSRTILNDIVGLLKKYPSYHVKIGGHTDSIGESGSNQRLSEKRAKTCYDYLIKNGISGSRLSYPGTGSHPPLWLIDYPFRTLRQTVSSATPFYSCQKNKDM